jgi:hypothetical protein
MKRSDFVEAVFKVLKLPTTTSRIYFGVAWAASEGSEAKNNPFDTTEPYPDATEFNSTGVKNYKTWEDGIYATVTTLKNGNYEELLNVLKDPKSNAARCIMALNGSSWGSHVSLELFTDVMDKYEEYNTHVVGSPTGDVAPIRTVSAPAEGSLVPTREDVTGVSEEKEDKVNDAEKEALLNATPETESTAVVAADGTTTVVPEPVAETDTLEDRLKKLYDNVETDVRTDIEKLADEVGRTVTDVETATTPEKVTDFESRLSRVETIIKGFVDVAAKF